MGNDLRTRAVRGRGTRLAVLLLAAALALLCGCCPCWNNRDDDWSGTERYVMVDGIYQRRP